MLGKSNIPFLLKWRLGCVKLIAHVKFGLKFSFNSKTFFFYHSRKIGILHVFKSLKTLNLLPVKHLIMRDDSPFSVSLIEPKELESTF